MRRRPVLRIVSRGGEWLDVRKTVVVKSSLPVPGSKDRIVLLFWSLSDEPRLRNVARIGPDGLVQWRASLPGAADHDCFVSLGQRNGQFLARTYAGYELLFDADGRPIEERLAG